MAARDNACVERIGDCGKIQLHSLAALHFKLFEYMIIRRADKYPGLLESEILHKLEILAVCADPCGYLGKRKSEPLAFFKRFPVLFAVNEKFRLADYALRSPEPMVERHLRDGIVFVYIPVKIRLVDVLQTVLV